MAVGIRQMVPTEQLLTRVEIEEQHLAQRPIHGFGYYFVYIFIRRP